MVQFLDGMTPVVVLVACLWAGIGVAGLLGRRLPRLVLSPGAEALVFAAMIGGIAVALAVGRLHPVPALVARFR